MESVTTAIGQRPLEVLSFEIGGQRYALASSVVRELVRAIAVVPLPKAPGIVEGVIDVRGSLVPVLDVRARFRLPPKPLALTDHFVLAWAASRVVALRVDRALDLIRLDAGQVEDAKAVVPSAEYVAGVAKLPDGLVLIHDLETFLDEAERATLDAALARPPEGPEQ